MPLYEYYCEDCDGIFELIRPVRESSDPQPCPICDGDGQRLMPTQVHAFTMRRGMPRRIPDKGLYWSHMGQTTRPTTSTDSRKMEPYLVKEPRTAPASTKLTPEELAAGKAPEVEVRERKKGSKSRGRRRAEAAKGS